MNCNIGFEAHKEDRTTADEISQTADIRKHLQEAVNYKDSDDEKKARLYLTQLGIRYDALTKKEFVALIAIHKKSVHMKSPHIQRGKANPHPSHGK